MFGHICVVFLFVSSLVIVVSSLPTSSLPWMQPQCFPKFDDQAINRADCSIVIREFVTSNKYPRYTFTHSPPRRPRSDVIVCPWIRTYRTCSLIFHVRNDLVEQHELEWVGARALYLMKHCTENNQIGGRMRIGNGLVVGIMRSSGGRLTETLTEEGNMGNSTDAGFISHNETSTS